MKNELPNTSKILFISDAHLGGFSPKKNTQIETELIKLVQYAQDHDFEIAVLGDLFDYWMEYKNHVPRLGKKILQRFEAFNKTNRSLYITGNHDNWTRGYFGKLGFDVERDFRVLKVGSQKALLLHGDAIGDNLQDLKRPLLHRVMRNKTFVNVYKTLFQRPETGIQVMKYYSRFANLLSKTDPEPLNSWSKKMLQTKDIDVVICGHDHVPRVHNYPYGQYLNTGPFYEKKTLVIYNNQQFKLVCWNEAEQKLIPFTPNK